MAKDGLFSENELFVGGYYKDISVTFENGITIIKGGRLVSVNILPLGTQADNDMKIERRHNND